jgi:tetraacyldisaccharide 4'-kinase
VIGNISTGGTGKTPLVITIAHFLKDAGYNPGIVSRGYKGNAPIYPVLLNGCSHASDVGDEPLLLANVCPVSVDPNRYRAASHLLENTDCDVILSDDGLQHYKLPRDIEIAVINGRKKFGNGQLLPSGPLREPLRRLKEVDFIVTSYNSINFKEDSIERIESSMNNSSFSFIKPIRLKNLVSNEVLQITNEFVSGSLVESFVDGWEFSKKVHAVAGIGDPHRFANTLTSIGFEPILHSLNDHHYYNGDEFLFEDELPVIITAKDAVKCKKINSDKIWVLDIEATVDSVFSQSLLEKLRLIDI